MVVIAFAETQKLIIDLLLTGNLVSGLGKAQKGLKGFAGEIDKTQSKANQFGQHIGIGIKNVAKLAVVAETALAGVLGKAVKDGQDAARVQEIYANAIKNSGRVSSQYVGILNKQQEALLQLGGVDDELIKSEQTRLIQMGLTGKRVAQLTPLILDVAKATGKDLLTVTTAVGKAANGQTTALARLGIVIHKTKDKTKAYALVVKELTDRFGGATKAVSGDFSTRLAVLREELSNVSEDVGQKLLPSLTKIVDVAGKQLVPAFASFVNSILPDVVAGLDKVANFLQNGGAQKAVAEIRPLLDSFAASAKVTGAVIETAVKAFLSLPPELRNVALGGLALNKLTGGIVTNIGGGLIGKLFDQFGKKGGSPADPLFVKEVGLPGAGGAGGDVAKGGIGVAIADFFASSAGVAAIAVAVPLAVLALPAYLQLTAKLDPTIAAASPSPGARFAGGKYGYVTPGSLGTGQSGLAAEFGSHASFDGGKSGFGGNAALHAAFKPIGDLGAAARDAAASLRKLTATEASILGGLDPRKGHAFRTAQRTYIQTHTNQSAATVADAVTKRFTIGGTKFTSDQKNAVNELRALKGLQARFLARGDTKTAGRIGHDIADMRRVIAGKVGTVKSAIDRKKLSIKPTFNVKIPVSLDGRELGAALARFQTLHETSGGD